MVIITHHGDRYVGTALRSVLAQSHRALEVVVVEDGSRDRAEQIVTDAGDTRVRYLWQPQGGPNAARNTGVRATTAPWIAFLDVDDRWHEEKLAAQLHALAQSPDAGAVYSSAIMVPEGDDDPAHQVRLDAELSGDILRPLLEANQITGSASSVMVHRDVLGSINGFDESIRYSEDWDCWIRLAAVTRFACVATPHVFLLVRASSHGRNSEALRQESHRIIDRAFATWAAADQGVKRRAHAKADFVASVDFSERGMRRDAWRTLLLAIRRDPLRWVHWKRGIVLLIGRA